MAKKARKKRQARKHTTREARNVRVNPPLVHTRETHPSYFFDPDGPHPRPTEYIGEKGSIPCPRCNRFLDDRRNVMVRCNGIHGGKAYLYCMYCLTGEGKPYAFSLPVAKGYYGYQKR